MAKGYRITSWHILAVGLVLLLVILYFSGAFERLGVTPPPKEEEMVSVNRQIQFSLLDPLAGSAVASATVQVYDGTQLVDSLTTTSAGIANTTLPYKSGKTLNVKVSKSLYVTRWFVVTVPKMTPADINAVEYNSIPLTTYTLGTFSIIARNSQTGAVITTADKINMTTYTTTPLQITFTVINSVDNTGYISSYDPVNKVNLNAVVVASSAQSYLTIQNAGTYAPRGTVSNWLTVANDDQLTRELVGGVYLKPGQFSLTITLYKGSLPLRTVANQTLTVDMYKYFDAAYFAQQGIGGPDAAAAPSQFSLTFYGPDS